MGYYLYIPVKSATLRQRAITFFAENFRPIVPEAVPPSLGKDVCAYAKPEHVGFYYGAGERDARAYTYGMIRWLALRLNRNPHYFYEEERRRVLLMSEHPHIKSGWNQEFDLVDEVGFAPSTGVTPEEAASWEPGLYKDLAEAAFKADALIRPELERLTRLWPLGTPSAGT